MQGNQSEKGKGSLLCNLNSPRYTVHKNIYTIRQCRLYLCSSHSGCVHSPPFIMLHAPVQNPCDSEEGGKKRHMKTMYLSDSPWRVSNFILSVKSPAHSNCAEPEWQHSQNRRMGEVGRSNPPAQAVPSVSLGPGEMTLCNCALKKTQVWVSLTKLHSHLSGWKQIYS